MHQYFCKDTDKQNDKGLALSYALIECSKHSPRMSLQQEIVPF